MNYKLLTIELIGMKYEKVNIGQCITQKINELGITKSEFARRSGIANQNINRVLEKSSIDTDKLIAISEALDFNFFDYYIPIGFPTEMSTTATATGTSSIAAINSDVVVGENVFLEEKIRHLEALLAEKERLINVLLEGRK